MVLNVLVCVAGSWLKMTPEKLGIFRSLHYTLRVFSLKPTHFSKGNNYNPCWSSKIRCRYFGVVANFALWGNVKGWAHMFVSIVGATQKKETHIKYDQHCTLNPNFFYSTSLAFWGRRTARGRLCPLTWPKTELTLELKLQNGQHVV